MSASGKPWWQQATAVVTVSAGGVLTGMSFVPGTAADLASPVSLPVHLLALEQSAQPGHAGQAGDALLRSTIVNVAQYYRRLAESKSPAEMEALIWQHASTDGVDHGQSCAAFASLTLELAAQVAGQQSWVTGGTTYPWPLHKWADARVDPNPESLGVTSVLQDAEAHHRWHPLGDGYRPQPGDWVMFHGHVEVVTKDAGGILQTIGGDSLPDFSVNAHEFTKPLAAQGITGFVNNGAVGGVTTAAAHSHKHVTGHHRAPGQAAQGLAAVPGVADSSSAALAAMTDSAVPAPSAGAAHTDAIAGTQGAAVPGLPAQPARVTRHASEVRRAAGTDAGREAPAGVAAIPGAPVAAGTYHRHDPSSTVAPGAVAAPSAVAGASAQQAFIGKIAPGAVASQRRYGVPAAVTIAQAIDESGWGLSKLATADHNLFGIKGTGPAGTVSLLTHEYESGRLTSQPASFRAYHSAAQSINDHGDLLANSGYYTHAMANKHNPDAFAHALTGIYATDPSYGAKLVSLMRQYNLYRYDIPSPEAATPVAATPVAARGSASVPGLTGAAQPAAAAAQPDGPYRRHDPSATATPATARSAPPATGSAPAPARGPAETPAARSAAAAAPAAGASSQQAFIGKIAPGAVAAQRRYGVPAAVTIAQAIDESAWGGSGLAANDHNLFGVKGTGPAGSVELPTTEYEHGQPVSQAASFRVYHNVAESIDDHGKLLATSGYYTHAMASKHNPDAFAHALTGIYATDPSYGAKLVSLMRQYNLYRYDIAAPSPTSHSTAPHSNPIPGLPTATPAPSSPPPAHPHPSHSPTATPSPAPTSPAPSSSPSPSPTSPAPTTSAPTTSPSPTTSAPTTSPSPGPSPTTAPSPSSSAAGPTSPTASSAPSTPSAPAPSTPDSPGPTSSASPSTPAPRASTEPGPVSQHTPPAGSASIPGASSSPAPAPAEPGATSARTDAYGSAESEPGQSMSVETMAAVRMSAPTKRVAVPPVRRAAPAARPARKSAARTARRAPAYQDQIPQSVKSAFLTSAELPLVREEPLYRDVASHSGIRWEILAACDWMQCEARSKYSPVHGEKLGTVNPDGSVFRTRSEALAQCADELAGLAWKVYEIDLTAGSELSVRDLANVFAAFRWGGLLRLHHTSAMEFPYSVAGLTAQHISMRWPRIASPQAPDRPGSKFRAPFGAVPIVLGLNYAATV